MSFWTYALFTVCLWCPGADFDTRRAHEVALGCLLATLVAFGPLRANVLHVYQLFKVVGLVRLLDTHRRGIHPLDEPLAISVQWFDNATAFGPRRSLQTREGAVAKRTPRHRSSAESSLQGRGFAQLPSLGALAKVANE